MTLNRSILLTSLLTLAISMPSLAGKNRKEIYLEQNSNIEAGTFTLALEFDAEPKSLVKNFGDMDPTKPEVEIYYMSTRGAFKYAPVTAPDGRKRFQTSDITWVEEMTGAVLICTEPDGCASLAEEVPTYLADQRYHGLLEKRGQLYYYKALEPVREPTATPPPPSLVVNVPQPPPASSHVPVPSIRP